LWTSSASSQPTTVATVAARERSEDEVGCGGLKTTSEGNE